MFPQAAAFCEGAMFGDVYTTHVCEVLRNEGLKNNNESITATIAKIKETKIANVFEILPKTVSTSFVLSDLTYILFPSSIWKTVFIGSELLAASLFVFFDIGLFVGKQDLEEKGVTSNCFIDNCLVLHDYVIKSTWYVMILGAGAFIGLGHISLGVGILLPLFVDWIQTRGLISDKLKQIVYWVFNFLTFIAPLMLGIETRSCGLILFGILLLGHQIRTLLRSHESISEETAKILETLKNVYLILSTVTCIFFATAFWKISSVLALSYLGWSFYNDRKLDNSYSQII